MVLEPDDVETWIVGHGHIDEQHLSHIPAHQMDEPVLLAPVPDGEGHVMIDGSHRATVRIRAGLSVEAFLLTPIESALAVGVAVGCCLVIPSTDADAQADEGQDDGEAAASAEGCGCVPRRTLAAGPSDADGAQAEAVDTIEARSNAAETVTHRALKLVVLLRPDGTGYRAHLAVGSDGCDPELRVIDVPDLPTALLALTDVTAAAETRWHAQQRYPPASRQVSAPRHRAVASNPPPPARTDRTSTSAGDRSSTQTPPIDPAQDHLSLFG